MDKKKVLVITHSKDNDSVAQVMRFIEASGGHAIRFDVDQYPAHYSLTSLYKEGIWLKQLRSGDQVDVLDRLSAVWYRRAYGLGTGLGEQLDPAYYEAAMGETKHTLVGMIEGLDCFKLARPSTYRRLDSKEEQLKVAVGCGLAIPPTCISNDPTQIFQFIQEIGYPVVSKMQSSFAVYQEGTEYVMYTNEIDVAHLEQLASVQWCPMVFQKKIPKKLELRITIVGEVVFAFSIDSQKESNAQTDWRREGGKLLKDWQPYALPEGIKRSLLQLMETFQLSYGAIDMILTPEEEYYFLEVNAAGEYFWLDRLCGFAISKQIAAVLLGGERAKKVE